MIAWVRSLAVTKGSTGVVVERVPQPANIVFVALDLLICGCDVLATKEVFVDGFGGFFYFRSCCAPLL
jgi:hypothetical protein